MGSETDRLLEVDPLDDAREPSPPAKPVVLVQYRNRGVPLWLFIPLLIIVPMSVIAIYHRLVVVVLVRGRPLPDKHLNARSNEVRMSFSSSAVSKPAEPLALNSQPFVPEAAPVAPIPAPGSTTPSDSIRSASAPPIGNSPLQRRRSVWQPVPGRSGCSRVPIPARRSRSRLNPRVAWFGSSSRVGFDAHRDREPTRRNRQDNKIAQLNRSLQNPMIQLRPSDKTGDADRGRRADRRDRRSLDEGKESPEDSHGPHAMKSVKADGEPAGVFDVESGNGEVVEVKPEPLPTKEESLRQIADRSREKTG